MPATFLNTHVRGVQSVDGPAAGQSATGIPGPEALQVSQVERPSTAPGHLADRERAEL